MWCVIFICFKVFMLDMKKYKSKNTIAFFQVFESGGYDRCAYDKMCYESSNCEAFTECMKEWVIVWGVWGGIRKRSALGPAGRGNGVLSCLCTWLLARGDLWGFMLLAPWECWSDLQFLGNAFENYSFFKNMNKAA